MKTPSQAEIKQFMQRWTVACMQFDVRAIDEMLKPKYLNLWWHIWHLYDPAQPFAQTCRGAVGTILQRMGLVTDATVRVVQPSTVYGAAPKQSSKAPYRLSEAGRAKIVAAAKKRWAAHRKAKAALKTKAKPTAAPKKPTPKPTAPKKSAPPKKSAVSAPAAEPAPERPTPPTIQA
jgi:hypothetical protein